MCASKCGSQLQNAQKFLSRPFIVDQETNPAESGAKEALYCRPGSFKKCQTVQGGRRENKKGKIVIGLMYLCMYSDIKVKDIRFTIT